MSAEDTPGEGRHWLLDLADCACAPELLGNAPLLQERCRAICIEAGMHVVGSAFHQFEPAGVTGVVLLAESHLSIHTWPAQRFAAVDIYVCNHARCNDDKGDAAASMIRALLQPGRTEQRALRRGRVGSA